MKKLAIIATALIVAGASAAQANHRQVADPARLSTENSSGNADRGWEALSNNGSNGKAAAAADKTGG